jgi:NAD(P)-dependent dehydrogenase (short-subunit alcohol dehydrogenase family)
MTQTILSSGRNALRRGLVGRKVVITGAARGIGERVARLTVARGARVALIGLEPDRLSSLAEDLGPAASWWEADVRNGAALQSAIDDAAQRLGGLDIVVANAGVAAYGTVRQANENSFERVMDINLNGVFRTLKYATPHLERSRGHAVVIASAMSFTPLAGFSAYAASKAAVEMLALTYRQEVAHLGVSVGIIHPAFVDTDLVRGLDADLPSFQELRARLPYPCNVTTSLDRAAAAIVSGLARRRTRVYIPRAVGIANWAKAALSSPAARPLLRRLAGEEVPALEREVEALGRNDQLVPAAESASASTAVIEFSSPADRAL